MTTRFTGLPVTEKRRYLMDLLCAGEVTVTFTKVNGETRVMPCTLTPALLPPEPIKESASKERKENLDTIRVYCTDKQAWRSFRVDSVTNITCIL